VCACVCVRTYSAAPMAAAAANESICLNGRNVLMRSNAFWHFAQGHMVETFALLQAHRLYAPSLRLSFGDKQFFRTWRPLLRFYLALFDHVPTLDPGCRRATGRVLTYPYFGMGPSSRGAHRVFREHAANSSLVRSCGWLPTMHAIAAARRGARPAGARPARIVLLRRPNATSSNGPGRRILNAPALARALGRLARQHNATFFHGNIEGWAPLEQVDLLLETDVLLSYHGSGVGSGHFWMRPGSLVVEFQPPATPYCIFGVCGAASGKAWVESGDARTPQMEVWKPGGWNSRAYICNPADPASCHRRVDLAPTLRVLRSVLGSRESDYRKPFGAFIANRTCDDAHVHGCARACGRRILQVWEGSQRCPARPGARNGRIAPCAMASEAFAESTS
jgi:hypothetical protein